MYRKVVLTIVSALILLGVSAEAKVLEKVNVEEALALIDGNYLIKNTEGQLYLNDNIELSFIKSLTRVQENINIDGVNYTENSNRLVESDAVSKVERKINTINGTIVVDGQLIFSGDVNSLVSNCSIIEDSSGYYILKADIDNQSYLLKVEGNLIYKINSTVELNEYKLTSKDIAYKLYNSGLSIYYIDFQNNNIVQSNISNVTDVSVSIDGSLFYLSDNKVYKYEKNKSTFKYELPIKSNRFNVYDDKNIIAWSSLTREFWLSNEDANSLDNGWTGERGKWKYYRNYLPLVNDWLKYNNNWYYFDEKGYMTIGWFKVNDKWYYASEGGSLIKDTTIDGVEYTWDSYSLYEGWIGDNYYKDGIKQ